MDLTGTAAIISGGASGLGEASARALAAAGSTVVIADLNAERGEAVAAEIGGKFVQTDVADEASVTIAVDVAAALPSPLRVIVNCAGIGWAERTVNRDGSPHSYATFRKVIDINLIGTFNLMRIGAAAVARTEPVDADGQRGVVINTASVAGKTVNVHLKPGPELEKVRAEVAEHQRFAALVEEVSAVSEAICAARPVAGPAAPPPAEGERGGSRRSSRRSPPGR